jgi:hypothetical protein
VVEVKTDKCFWCGIHHDALCPKVESIEYYPDGTIRKITFFAPGPVVSYGLHLPGMGETKPS